MPPAGASASSAASPNSACFKARFVCAPEGDRQDLGEGGCETWWQRVSVLEREGGKEGCPDKDAGGRQLQEAASVAVERKVVVGGGKVLEPKKLEVVRGGTCTRSYVYEMQVVGG